MGYNEGLEIRAAFENGAELSHSGLQQKWHHVCQPSSPLFAVGETRRRRPFKSGWPLASVAVTLWAGRIMSALAALFLLMDGVMKLVKPAPVVEATVQLGYPESVIFGLGIVLLVCVVLYVIPRSSILGAIMLTGYLGGAVATHVRVGHPLFSHTLFPVYVAALVWGETFPARSPAARAHSPATLACAVAQPFSSLKFI